MFNLGKIQNELLGLVGIRQPYNLDYAIFDINNQLSESLLFVNDVGIFKPEFFIDNSDTVVTAELNDEFRAIKKTSIINVCTKTFGQKQAIDFQSLYTVRSQKVKTQIQEDGFYGYRLEQSKAQNRAVKINSVTLEFEGTGDLAINLVHSNSNEIIETKTITITSKHQVERLDWYIDSEIFYKGEYYLGYISNPLLKPYERDNNIINCITDLSVESVYEAGRDDFEDFDSQLLRNSGYSNYNGMNFSISVYEDYTRFILENKVLFAKAIQIEIVCQILNKVASSTRSNIKERYSKDLLNMILVEVRGYENRKGLEHLVLDEISILQRQLNEIKPFEPKIYFETLC